MTPWYRASEDQKRALMMYTQDTADYYHGARQSGAFQCHVDPHPIIIGDFDTLRRKYSKKTPPEDIAETKRAACRTGLLDGLAEAEREYSSLTRLVVGHQERFHSILSYQHKLMG
mgnify:CR=1 FL=1